MTRFHWLLLTPLLLALAAPSALSDGKAFILFRDWGAYRSVLENEQIAAIAHKDGVQRMVIAISFKAAEDDSALWIFPVPGTPELTKVDVVDTFPLFRGENPVNKLLGAVSTFMTFARATQIYPAIIEGALLPALGTSHGVLVHREVEKSGIHAEVISADSVESLAKHFTEKNSPISSDELKVYERYLAGDYVLIAAWISSLEKVRSDFPEYARGRVLASSRWPCLYVEFPCERPFYPLIPTSDYGEEYVTIELCLAGAFQPQGPFSSFEYSLQHYEQEVAPDAPEQFAAGLERSSFHYTRLYAHTKASYLTEDLYFRPARLRGWKCARAALWLLSRTSPVAWYVVFVGMLSMATAAIVGRVLFGTWRGYALLGLWNLLTLGGLWIAIRHVPGEKGDRLRSVVQDRFFGITFCGAFSITFVAITLILQTALLLPLL